MNYPLPDTEIHSLVFRTNIHCELEATRLVYILEKCDSVIDWNLDLEDWEKVLRIDVTSTDLPELEENLKYFGIRIEALPIW